MENLCIVPCGKRKIWDSNPNLTAVKAKCAYTGVFSLKCIEYAEKFYPGQWCILSAKFGFVFPEEMIPGPYDVSFNNKKSGPIAIDELIQQIKGLDEIENVIVLGGKKYTAVVEKAFLGKLVTNPLANCRGSGFMMQKINQAIKSGNLL